MLNLKKFADPPFYYRPGYFWCLGSKMDVDKLLAQLRDMAAHGAKSVCMHPVPAGFDPHGFMEPDYLTEEYWQIVSRLIDECEKLGMNYYLYDEGGFPSGGACGRVYASDPKRFHRHYVVADDLDSWRLEAEELGSRPPIPDLLDRGAAEKFIELTHEKHKKIAGRHFRKTIRYAFTDEPQMPRGELRKRMAWTKDFAEEFKKRKGYDIVPYLPKLVLGASTVPDDLARKRIDHRDVSSQLFVERYLLPIRDWCRKNGILSGGHFGGEEELLGTPFGGCGFILRSLRALDLPGVDLIWQQLYPGKRLHPFPKYASSVAHQNGCEAVLGELFAVYGAGLKPFVMKFLLDYMLLCGVNTFVFSNIAQDHRDGHMSGCRPLFGETDTLWKYSRCLHDYAGRMGWLCSRGKADVDTAVYFDANALILSYQMAEYAMVRHEKISQKLQEYRVAFDFVDDDVLKTAKTVSGKLVIGKMSYKNLLIPYSSLLDPDAEKRLDEFRRKGINVINEDSIDDIEPIVNIAPFTSKIYASKWKLPHGQALYFLLNTTSKTVDIDVTFKESGKVALCDGDSGRIYEYNSSKCHFEPYSSMVFLVGSEDRIIEKAPEQPGEAVKQIKSWKMRPVSQVIAGEHDYYTETPDTPAVAAKCGDWRNILADDFSGDVLYTASFLCEDPEKCRFIDLGKVSYSASVKLNGKTIGSKLWGPFVFDISKAVKKGRNILEVTVSNTLANVLSPEELKERWIRDFPPLSSYETKQRIYEKESLESGLFGPVLIKKAK